MHQAALLSDAPATSGSATTASRLPSRPAVDLEVVIPAFNEERRLPATLRAHPRLPGRAAAGPARSSSSTTAAPTAPPTSSARATGGPVPVHLVGCAEPGQGRRRPPRVPHRPLGDGRLHGRRPGDPGRDARPRRAPARGRLHDRHRLARRATSRTAPSRRAFLRRMGGEVFRAAARTVLPHVADSQCGFKFFRGPAVRDAPARPRGRPASASTWSCWAACTAPGTTSSSCPWCGPTPRAPRSARCGTARAPSPTPCASTGCWPALPEPVRTIDLTATTGAVSVTDDRLVGASR